VMANMARIAIMRCRPTVCVRANDRVIFTLYPLGGVQESCSDAASVKKNSHYQSVYVHYTHL